MVKIGQIKSSLIGNKFAQSGHTAGKVEQIIWQKVVWQIHFNAKMQYNICNK